MQDLTLTGQLTDECSRKCRAGGMLGLADRVNSEVLDGLWQWACQCHMGIGHDFSHLHHTYFTFVGSRRQPGHRMVSTRLEVQTRVQLRVKV